MSHSLYTYEIEDNEFISKYQQENDDFRQFVEFVSDYNEEVIEVNKKSNLVLTKTAQMKNDINMLQTPSLIIKKQNIVFNNGRILKKRGLNSNFNLKTSNTTKLSLNSLKQVMKNGCNFLTNSANSILPNSLSPINNHSKEHTNKFVLSKGIISLNNKFHRNNIIDDNLSESPLKQIHHRLLTPLLIDSSFDPKKILTKEFDIFELKNLIGTENVLPLIGKTILDAFGINHTMLNISKLDSFLQKVSNSYNINVPYHNSIHGSDVTQTISLFFLNSNAEELCATSMLNILSIFIAALGHDLGHPGLTNNYQINS